MAKTQTRVKVIFTKVGTAYDATKAYRLHDYIVLNGVTVYACKKVDKTTMTCVGRPLTDTDYWDKFIDMAEFKAAAEQATTAATTAAKSANDAASAATTAKANADAATKKATDAAGAATTAATNANTATQNANDAATASEKVNATITAENVLEVTDRTGAKKTLALADQTVTKEKLAALEKTDEQQNTRIGKLEQAVADLGGTSDAYYYASQDTSQPSPDLVNPQTNASIQLLQDMYRPFLVDHTEAKEGVEVMPADELKRNNWLRYANGKFAPAVGITEEMRAE